jgi:hypothetical protein
MLLCMVAMGTVVPIAVVGMLVTVGVVTHVVVVVVVVAREADSVVLSVLKLVVDVASCAATKTKDRD